MNVIITLNPGIGEDLGPNFLLTCDVEGWSDTATETELYFGVEVVVPDESTVVYIQSLGLCFNILTLPIEETTTTTTSSTEEITTTTTTTAIMSELRLVWDNISNVPVADANSVSDWNIFFDLPTYGGEFTYVAVDVNTVYLYSGIGITLKDYLFGDSDITGTSLLEIIDNVSITACGEGVFSDWGSGNGCYGLTKAYLPNCSVVGYAGFANCEQLSDVNIDKVVTLGDYVFEYNYNLLYLSCPELVSAGEYCFESSGLININMPLLETAGADCFSLCLGLVSVTLPKITFIGGTCFYNCSNLESISFPLFVNDINGAIFTDCTSLVSVSLPNLMIAGYGLFERCSALISISLPSLVTAGYMCFNYCTSLQTVELPLVESVGYLFFSHCYDLINVDMSSCTDLGGTTGNDNVFQLIDGPAITLTIPSSLMTCDSGNPDGDIQYLQTNYTATIITI